MIKQITWLYVNGQPLTSVVAPPGLHPHQIRDLAMGSNRRCPLGFNGEYNPGEIERLIRTADLVDGGQIEMPS
jgi:hypothetical protein